MSEKRRHPRKLIGIPVAFTLGDGRRIEAVSRDLSIGGMFVLTDTPAPFASSTPVELFIPAAKQPIRVTATVRWTQSDGMGLQFGLMGVRDTHALTELLRHAPPSPYGEK
ncbi:MAG: PilZ domain-containing protein [Polyangiaceae bacterium]|nr:PilZ domain-containing protein [Polyangiaceae bacterium]